MDAVNMYRAVDALPIATEAALLSKDVFIFRTTAARFAGACCSLSGRRAGRSCHTLTYAGSGVSGRPDPAAVGTTSPCSTVRMITLRWLVRQSAGGRWP
jgi:hypothetical protein